MVRVPKEIKVTVRERTQAQANSALLSIYTRRWQFAVAIAVAAMAVAVAMTAGMLTGSSSRNSSPGTNTWVQDMSSRLRRVRRRRGEIDTASYLEALEPIPDVYDILLSLKVVASAMRRDITDHIANVRSSMKTLPEAQGHTLEGIVRYGLANYERDALAHNPGSVVGGVLWLNRATTFIADFIRGLADGKSSQQAANTAYDGLKIYHRPLTSAFVSRATALCPDRERIMERMEFPNEAAAKAQLEEFLNLIEPLVHDVRDSLDRLGGNFPDRVG